MEAQGQQTVMMKPARRARPGTDNGSGNRGPEPTKLAETQPTGSVLHTDGLYFQQHSKTRVLGAISRLSGDKFRAYSADDTLSEKTGYTELGVFPDRGAAMEAIKKVNPLYDGKSSIKSDRARRRRPV